MMPDTAGTRYYLVYENIGIQDWIMLSASSRSALLTPAWIRCGAGRSRSWSLSRACFMVLLIALIVRRSRDALRRRDTEILYRDELFTGLTQRG